MESISQLLQLIPKYDAVPEIWKTLLPILASCVFIFALLAVVVLFLVWLERKISAHIQDRLGPMYVGGWHGWAQTIADALKLLLKEDLVPESSDRVLFKMAPFIVFLGAFAAYVVVPFGVSSYVADLNIGILYVVALGSLSVVGIIMAGWASNNKYSLYGGMRAAAQIISYEIPAAIAIMTVIIPVGSLSMVDIVKAQQGGIQNWFLFRNPFIFFAFFVYFIASLAEVNRTPFDIPEAESELVAGFHTEYSGMRFAFFFLAEYANMLLVACVATTLFLGGWSQVLPGNSQLLPGPVMFFLKAFAIIFVQMWLRWSVPRLRVDQLMYLSWKVLLPISFVLLLGVGCLAVYW
ncbi:MAG: NADH-quinone oxidoreductase subunit NuoH [Acidobacteriota bacterium]|jgi:NADH-quinone oxidoreductase subunit H|nr:NADH-quinone oxidoreductase subunit NuoH [Acidobacteriota bacterium]